jgi:uncharacterized protein (AIM24 family)
MPELHTVPAAYADDETVDTDFVHHLVRGAELLQTGDAAVARGMLERALRLRPKNQRGQNLLALSYFKLGQFDRAEQIYRTLISDYPKDATLRLNLGLVHLKTRRTEDAVLTFASVLDLEPEHKKAQSYLGLAYMQQREYERAGDWFARAGNTAMAERMTALLNAPLKDVGDGGIEALDASDVPFSAAVEATPALTAAGPWTALQPAAALADVIPEPAAPDLTSFSAANRIENRSGAPFLISPTMVVVEVRAEMFVRLDGLVAVFGGLEFKPAFKRFRGRVTEKPFGEPGRRMMHVAGQGRLWIGTGSRQFHDIEIGDEPAYFREDALFGFEESLLFENGRVPSKYSGDLQLIHLRNRGRALITSKHQPRSMDVTRGEPCRVMLDVLLGWHGNITPRVVAIAEEALPEGLALAGVELSGEGRVLLDAPL